jgi:hypothetical protein
MISWNGFGSIVPKNTFPTTDRAQIIPTRIVLEVWIFDHGCPVYLRAQCNLNDKSSIAGFNSGITVRCAVRSDATAHACVKKGLDERESFIDATCAAARGGGATGGARNAIKV